MYISLMSLDVPEPLVHLSNGYTIHSLTFYHSNGILKCMREVAQECELLVHTTGIIRVTEVDMHLHTTGDWVLKIVDFFFDYSENNRRSPVREF